MLRRFVSEPARADSIKRNFAFSLTAQLSSAFLTAVLTLFLARTLDPEGYGLFALALGVGLLVLLPSDFGVAQSAGRFIAERRGVPAAVAAILADAIALKLVLSGLVCGALALLAPVIADAYGEPDLVWPLRAIAIAVFAHGLFLLFNGTFIAIGRTSLQLRLYLGESAVEFTTSVALVLLGGGAAGAAFGRAIGYVAGALLGLALVLRLYGRSPLPRAVPSKESRRRILGYGGALLIIDAAFTLFEQIDVLLIGAYLGAASVGLFQAPLRLITFIHLAGGALGNAIAPRLARNEHEGPRVDALVKALRGLTVLGVLAAVFIAVWAEPAVHLLLGDEFAESAPVLRAFAPYAFMGLLGPLVTLSVNFLGEARRRIPLVLAAVAINGILDVILIPRIGIVGGAIATNVAYLVYLPGHLWIIARMLDVDMRPLAATFARALVAGAALAGLLALLGTERLSAPEWALGLLVGPPLFLAVLVVIGEVSAGQVRQAAERAFKVVRRRAD